MKNVVVHRRAGMGLALLLALSTLDAFPGYGGIVKLAESGDLEPGGTNMFFEISAFLTLNDLGQVAFQTDLRNNGFLQGWGIFLADTNGVQTVARTGEPSPDANGNFYTFNGQCSLNNTSQVFQTTLNGTLGGGADSTAIYQHYDHTISQVARAGQAVPEGGATFRGLSGIQARINRNGQVAFRSASSTNADQIYRYSNGVLTRMAYSRQPSPDGDGFLLTFFADPTLNNLGNVAFVGTVQGTSSSGFVLFLSTDGTLKVLARAGQTVPDGNGQILFFSSPNPGLNDLDQAVFVANLSGTTGGSTDNLGVYRADGTQLVQLVRKAQFVPDHNGRFLDFFQNYVAINNHGVAAFTANLTGTSGGTADNQAVFLADGTNLTQVVRKGQLAPDGNGVFAGFGSPALNQAGQLAFTATLTGTSGGTKDNEGVFVVTPGLTIKQAIRSGEVIGGETVFNPTFLGGPDFGGLSGFNQNGQLALSVDLNGNNGVLLWTDSEATAPPQILGLSESGANLTVSWQGAGGTTNFVQTASNVTGPFADIASVVLPGSGTVSTNFTDFNAGTHQTRFYRIRSK